MYICTYKRLATKSTRLHENSYRMALYFPNMGDRFIKFSSKLVSTFVSIVVQGFYDNYVVPLVSIL